MCQDGGSSQIVNPNLDTTIIKQKYVIIENGDYESQVNIKQF